MTNPFVQQDHAVQEDHAVQVDHAVQEDHAVQVDQAVQPRVERNPHEVAVHRRYNAFMLNVRGLSRCHAHDFNAQYNHHSWIAKERFVPDFVKYFGFNVPKKDTISITMNPINLDKTGEKFYHLGLNITYTTPGFYANIANFPVEICDKIFAFSCYEIELRVQITFTDTYPFEAPIWGLVGVKHTIPKANLPYPTYKLSDYYQHAISMHNNIIRNPENWSPAIDIEKDILDFLRKINHFPEMFHAIQ
jgi:hypothetical protein